MSRWRRFWANPYKLRLLALGLQRLKARLGGERLPAWLGQEPPLLLKLPADLPRYFRQRPGPRFFFDAATVPSIVEATPAAAVQALLAQAQRQLLTRTFCFRGQPALTLNAAWEAPPGSVPDPEWWRDWHRLEWLVEGLLASFYGEADRLAPEAAAALHHWWASYPPGSAPWRDPFEVAQRGYTLTWLFFLGLYQPLFPASTLTLALQIILVHGLWLADHLEYQTPNNHLLLEALRLAQLGLLFPEFPPAAAWCRRGRRLVQQELRRQILADGFHAELSVFYQRLVLEALLEDARLWECQGLPPPAPLPRILPRMLWTLGMLQRPDGSYPEVGDGFAADVLLRHELFALGQHLCGTTFGNPRFNLKTFWLLAGRWPRPRTIVLPAWHHWEAAGYLVSRQTRPTATRLLLDVGPFGYPPAPGHGHADCLNLLLEVAGQPLLVDAGTGSYADHRWRSYWRGTAAHNTVVVAGQDQTQVADLFASGRPARPRLETLIAGDLLRLAVASHDGYHRLRPPVRHRRLLLELPEANYLVLDLLHGQGNQFLGLYWHFSPATELQLQGNAWRCRTSTGHTLYLSYAAWPGDSSLALIRGRPAPPQGWLAGPDGRPQATPTLAWEAVAPLPAALATLLQVQPQVPAALQLHQIPGGVAVTATAPEWSMVLLLRQTPGLTLTWPPWSTDGEIFICYRQRALTALGLIHGQEVQREGQPWLSLPGASAGLLLLDQPPVLELSGQVPLPLVLTAPEPRPVRVAGYPTQTRFVASRRQLLVSSRQPVTAPGSRI